MLISKITMSLKNLGRTVPPLKNPLGGQYPFPPSARPCLPPTLPIFYNMYQCEDGGRGADPYGHYLDNEDEDGGGAGLNGHTQRLHLNITSIPRTGKNIPYQYIEYVF